MCSKSIRISVYSDCQWNCECFDDFFLLQDYDESDEVKAESEEEFDDYDESEEEMSEKDSGTKNTIQRY